MLQNAVHNIAELNAVKQQAAQHKAQSGVDLTYLQYCNLLLLAATKYDLQFNMKKSSKTSYQQVYKHEITEEDDMLVRYYNIDSDLDVIQANITEHFNGQNVPHVSDKQ